VLGNLRRACPSWIVTTAAVLLLASAPASAGPDPAVPTPTCLASSSPTLSLEVVNAAGVERDMVDGAMAETVAIFERAGVRLVWTLTRAPRPTAEEGRLLVILARGPFPPEPPGVGKHRPENTLAWLPFDGSGRPGNVIRLSFHAIATLARRATMLNLRVATLPEQVQAPLLGRAIGRVLAHELGHWLAGREHTKDGLMSASFRERDLVDFWPPQLPREWTARGSARLRGFSECPGTATLAAAVAPPPGPPR
jgi:hypothetical protein